MYMHEFVNRTVFSTLIALLLTSAVALHGAQPASQSQVPASGQVIPLPGVASGPSKQMYQGTVEHALFKMEYESTRRESKKTRKMDEFCYMQKSMPDGSTKTLLVALKLFASQHNKILLWGETRAKDGSVGPNPDVGTLASHVQETLKSAKKVTRKFSPRELEIDFYQLSYATPGHALDLLQALGFNTGKPGNALTLDQLPRAWHIADSPRVQVATGREGVVDKLGQATEVGPQNRLALLYHRTQGKDVMHLKEVLDQRIDVPARQVLIEAIVLETTEEGRKELGVEWEWQERVGEVSGEFKPGEESGLELSFDEYQGKTLDVLQAKLQALIEDDMAEILSSPTVLTLNNSQAVMRVGRRVPVIRQLRTGSSFVQHADVDYEKVGIMLNIKPRVSQNSDIVAMQIQTEVSDVDEYFRQDDRIVAPLVSTRLVSTNAHVKNNTPFIIGGLIRHKGESMQNRVPILSTMPVLGRLFQNQMDTHEKREVIIVLTPRVLNPTGPNRALLPMDSARFDFLDNRLFRNSYRLKSEDIFDLGFIRENESIQKTFRKGREFAKDHPEVAEDPPFSELREDVLPGEESVIIRMLYEIVKKLDLHERVKLENLIYFQSDPDKPAGFDVEFLQSKLRSVGAGEGDYPRNVLILRYDLTPGSELSQITETPVADIEVKEVESRDEVEKLWAEENSIEEGNYHPDEAVLVLDNQDDFTRLKTAIVVREMINVNESNLTVRNFRVGRRIVIPEIQKGDDRIFLINHNVARYHYMTEYYYAAFRNKLMRYYDGIKSALKEYGLQ